MERDSKKLSHPIFRTNREIKYNFNPSEIDKSKNKKGIDKNEIRDEFLFLEGGYIRSAFQYDYLGKKLFVPELNPIIIFYSNAEMSYKKLLFYKEELLNKLPTINKIDKGNIKPDEISHFFQFAINCIINMQATIECFANKNIRSDFKFKNEKGKYIRKDKMRIKQKIRIGLPDCKKKSFDTSNPDAIILIEKIIDIRNSIIHLQPNLSFVQYKDFYKELLDFRFDNALIAVKDFINFYESNLIEKCSCGKDLFFDINEL